MCHKIFCWPAMTTCPTPASLRLCCSENQGDFYLFSVLCLTRKPSIARSGVITWRVAVIPGEKGYQKAGDGRSSFLQRFLFSKPNWRCLFLYQGQEGTAEKPVPQWFDFFLLCSAAIAVWKKKSNQVRWKEAVSPQLCPASWKSLNSGNEARER